MEAYHSDVIGCFIWDLSETSQRRTDGTDVAGTYQWDVLVTYKRDVVGCFIWDLSETLWRRTDGTSLLRPLQTSSRRSNKTSWRRTTEPSWQPSIETSLGVSSESTCDVTGTYRETSLRCRCDVLLTDGTYCNAL